SDHRVWRTKWWSRRRGAVPDVSASDSRSTSAKIPQLRSRSAIQVPSMAIQSSSTRGEGNQDGSLRAAFASLRRTTDRHRSARVFGQDSILDYGRLGDEATRLPTLLNAHRPHAGLDGRLPEPDVGGPAPSLALGSYRWQKHCRGLYQTPIAA